MLNLLDPQPTLQVGQTAPDFELPDAEGQAVRLYDLLAKGWVVLFFYPKDNTPGCTAQACSFRNSYQEFRALGAQIFGISADSKESHQGFSQQQNLPYPLLSDSDGAVAKAFGVKKTLGLLPGRATFVIAPDRTVRLAYASQLNPESHQQKALEVLQNQKQA
ncbi:peroxiredoxin [Vampirovibrio chlorellavorus]|uniref:peroxiredoxin n=1 Tax=Vampirovibrio chlorellavorus TaxID=758823 RepID=UPI0026EE5571|nr:peroxiredoxin [Vampirovibrio chlorellavorus]